MLLNYQPFRAGEDRISIGHASIRLERAHLVDILYFHRCRRFLRIPTLGSNHPPRCVFCVGVRKRVSVFWSRKASVASSRNGRPPTYPRLSTPGQWKQSLYRTLCFPWLGNVRLRLRGLPYQVTRYADHLACPFSLWVSPCSSMGLGRNCRTSRFFWGVFSCGDTKSLRVRGLAYWATIITHQKAASTTNCTSIGTEVRNT